MEKSRRSEIEIIITGNLSCLLLVLLVSCISCSERGKENKTEDLENLLINYNEDSTSVVSFGLINEFGANGEWMYFDPSGRLERIQTFKNGVLHGTVKEFLCCQKFSTYGYKAGTLDGEIVYYSSEGYISSKGRFKEGKMDGVWSEFLDGRILSVSFYKDEKEMLSYINEKYKNSVVGKEFFGCCKRH